ncbi:ABC transporter ATP-binding protein [Vagococcus elongatus]|uniref:Multidrug ABC transporter ATP-binding protein n=1 Tax=Vagococcus elongatus TaxID=180344 RepID=A0A430AZS5_9ENTE|nr:ABC transporter ATP-binding protein [Vagococcus elongatus]RSU13568.1 multidrug ABC transporter ATP-binding protein [Vagococcus elongatus]
MIHFKWIWRYVKVYKMQQVVAMILLIISALLLIVNPLIAGKIVDAVIFQGQEEKLIPYLLLMIGVTLLRTIVRYIYQNMFEEVGQNVLFDLRKDMYHKLHELDFDYFNHTRVGDIMARMTGDTDAIRHFVSWAGYSIVESVLWFCVAMAVMFTINVPLTFIMILITPAIFILTRRISDESYPKFFDIRESFSRLNSMVEENISGNRVVKAFSREQYEIEKFNQVNQDYLEKNMASAKVSGKYLPALEFLAGLLSVMTLLFGGLFVIREQMSIGDLVAFNSYLWMLNNPLRMSGWLINDTQRFLASCLKIRELLSQRSSLVAVPETEIERLTGDIAFENVSFHFSDDPDTNILEDISFSVKAGQTIGILGQTGAGKTTLVNLIARFYDPTSGVVKLGGKDLRDWPIKMVREQVSMVMQDVFLFSNTIEENIAFSDPEMPIGKIRDMAEIADASHFIERMPEGYGTFVGERGVGLSGGQKQRISLARALAKEPAVLILDDTTSAVDMETENKIQKKLDKVTNNTTTFIIAHRISSVREADLILVMEKGRVVEQGTHASLIEQNGEYAGIYRKQLGLDEGSEANG